MHLGEPLPSKPEGVWLNHLHWMKLYIGDELSNTAHMTVEEFGAYISLKMHYWRFGCLSPDDERLARIARVSVEKWQALKPAIGPLFENDWRDPKLEAQREEAEERHKKLSEAGKRGGRPKKDEKGGFKPGFSQSKASPKQPEPEPEPEPYSGSDLNPESDPDVLAYDKERDDKYTRSFPKPNSVEDGRNMLLSRGCPAEELKRCLGMLMEGHLTPFDIEAWDLRASA